MRRSSPRKLPSYFALSIAAALQIVERIAAVFLAVSVLAEKPMPIALATMSIVASHLGKRALAGLSRIRFIARGHLGTVDALLSGNVTERVPFPEEDVQTSLLEGIEADARARAELRPGLMGDVVAAGAIGLWISLTQRPSHVLLATGAAFIAIGMTLAARALVSREELRIWSTYRPVLDRLQFAALGRLAVVAEGRELEFLSDAETELEAWRRQVFGSSARIAFVRRAPLAGVAVLILVMLRFHGTSTWSSLVAELAPFVAATPAFAGIIFALHELAKGAPKMYRLERLREKGRERRTTGTQPTLPFCDPGSIRLGGVKFKYAESASSPYVIDGLSFTWSRGALGIVGPNGSGKSTLLYLLANVLEPSEGTITVGEAELSVVAFGWHRLVSILPQRPFFFLARAIREDFRRHIGEASEAEIERALRQVGLWSALLERDPRDPLSVPLSDLSAGQRQRAAIARVLCQSRPVLILDEPDASLDAEGRSLVANLLDELKSQRRIIFVAHSQELLNIADQLVYL